MSATIGKAADKRRARIGGSWTRKKLIYLERYAAAFMTAMAPKRAQGKWDSLDFIDLLCGPGMVIIEGSTPEERKGSPLIALDTVPRFDRLFLGDLDEKNVKALRERIGDDQMSRVHLKAADCHERAHEVIQQLPTWRTLGLAFVDPEGFEVRFELLETLALRPIDILFLFPSGIGIKRNIRSFAQQEESPMDGLMGNRAWREKPIARLFAGEDLSQQEAEQLDESWVEAFCQRVRTLGYSFQASAPALRNDQNVPMYHLLFFSKSQAGLDIWNGIRSH